MRGREGSDAGVASQRGPVKLPPPTKPTGKPPTAPRQQTPDESASDDDVAFDDEDEEEESEDDEGFNASARSAFQSDGDTLDPSLLWFASRGTQCRTPDVSPAPGVSALALPSYLDRRTSAATDTEPQPEVFSIPIADYNARASHNVEDSDSSDDEARKGGITFHSPPKRGMVMVRVAGNRYGFSSDIRLRPEPIVPKFGRKTAEKSTQTTDRRITTRTRFAKEDANAQPVVVDTGAGGGGAGGQPKGKGQRKSIRGGRPGDKARSARRTSSKPPTGAKDKPGAAGAEDKQSPAASPRHLTEADESTEPASPGATEQAPSPNFNATTTSSRGMPRKSTVRSSRFGMSTRGPRGRSGTIASEKAQVKDPAEDYEWIDGIGNVPRRHPFYEQMRAVKPKARPASADIHAAMNQPRDDADPLTANDRPGDDRDTGDSPDPDQSTADRLMSSTQDSFLGDSASSRRFSGNALVTPDSMRGGGSSGQGFVPPAALRGAMGAGYVPVNPFLVEERRLPEIRDRNVRRAVIPVSEENFSSSGGGLTPRAQNWNPWAGAKFSYDPRKLMSSNASPGPSPPHIGRPTPATSRGAGGPTHPPQAAGKAATARGPAYQRPLPALHPDETLDAPPSGAGNTKGATASGADGGAAAATSAAAASAAKAADKDAKADTIKTAKQQVLDREREFAKMFPDWLASDDRLRAPPRGGPGTRASRR